jgi:hypothetical protein
LSKNIGAKHEGTRGGAKGDQSTIFGKDFIGEKESISNYNHSYCNNIENEISQFEKANLLGYVHRRDHWQQ